MIFLLLELKFDVFDNYVTSITLCDIKTHPFISLNQRPDPDSRADPDWLSAHQITVHLREQDKLLLKSRFLYTCLFFVTLQAHGAASFAAF